MVSLLPHVIHLHICVVQCVWGSTLRKVTWHLSWAQLKAVHASCRISQYPSFPGSPWSMVWAAWAALEGAAHPLLHWCRSCRACCAPSHQTSSVCARIRCQEICHCWTSLSHSQPLPMESSFWQAGHQEQVTQISQAMAGLLSRGQLGEHKCLHKCCAVPMDWAQQSVCVCSCWKWSILGPWLQLCEWVGWCVHKTQSLHWWWSGRLLVELM